MTSSSYTSILSPSLSPLLFVTVVLGYDTTALIFDVNDFPTPKRALHIGDAGAHAAVRMDSETEDWDHWKRYIRWRDVGKKIRREERGEVISDGVR